MKCHCTLFTNLLVLSEVRIINERPLPTNARDSEQYFSISTNEWTLLESQMRWHMSYNAGGKGKNKEDGGN